MIRALKSYWAFTQGWYRLVMLVLVPGGLVLVNSPILRESSTLIYSYFLLYAIDTMSDMGFMNGFYGKHNSALEFLQSSPRFERVSRDIVIVDMIRRTLTYQIPFLTILLSAGGDEEILQWYASDSFMPWIEILTAQLVVLVARHFVAWNHVYACAAFGYGTMLFGFMFLIFVGSEQPVLTNGILIVLILVADVVTVWYTLKKVRESYYDK